ncbi:hypothetical protein Sros01_63630 [Streptomyces roseochromogenus]|nr:hypothetical protein Sros01_63630 [Streptomyces roseochromogenus]
MLVGLSTLIGRFHLQPVGGVTVLAQLADASFGHNAAFYVVQFATMVLLAPAANTSFGGLPVLMSLPARDNHLPHVFALKADRQVHRHGVVWPALVSALLTGVSAVVVTATRFTKGAWLTVTHPAPEDRESAEALRRDRELWKPGVELIELCSETRSLGRPLAAYVRKPAQSQPEAQVTVLIPETEPARL